MDNIEIPEFEITRVDYIEDIYFFEVNTKYISSNVLKISGISQVRSMSEIADIFNTFDEIFLVFTAKKNKCSFYFFRQGEKLNFFPSHFSLILLGSARLEGIILGANNKVDYANTVCT